MMNGIISTSNLRIAPATFERPGARPKHNGGASMFGILTYKVSGIYEIRNTVNGHCYIGSAVDVNGRWRSHKSDLRKGKHRNQHLQRAWNKYGEACFRFSMIEQCERGLLIEREQFYMDAVHPEYNIRPKARSNSGLIPWNKGKVGLYSDETRRKLSEARKGKTSWNKGIAHSKETRKKISEANKGKTNWSKGAVRSKEHCKKISEAAKKRYLSEDYRRKMSEALKGRLAWNKGKKRKEGEK